MWALVLLLACVPFALTRYIGHTTLTTFKVALLGTLIGGAPLVVATLRERPRPIAFWLALGALLLATAATILTAVLKPVALRETLKAFEYALAATIAFVVARSARDDRRISAALAAIVSFVVLDALRDFIHPQSGFYVGDIAVLRLAGHLEGPNQLAAFIGIALPIMALSSARRSGWRSTLALAVATFGLVASFSRTGIIVAFAATIVVLVGQRWQRPALTMLAASAGAAAMFFFLFSPRSIMHIFSPLQESAVHAGGVGTRNDLWSAALRMWRSRPILGVGAGNFEYLLQRFGAPTGVRTHANSLYLEALADGGIVLALATTVAAWLVPIRLLARDPFVRAIGIAGIALAIHGVADDVTFYPKVGEWWWLLAGYGTGCAMRGDSLPSETPGIKYVRT